MAYSEGLEFTSNGDGTCYLSGIGTCTDTAVMIPDISPVGDIVTAIDAYLRMGEHSWYLVTSITIPDSVVVIHEGAFLGFVALKSIVIPTSVELFSEFVFMDCNSLTNIYYAGTEEEWNSIAEYAIPDIPSTTTITYNYVDPSKTPWGKLTRTNDAIRSLTGLTDKLTLDDMYTNLEAVIKEVETQAELINQITTILEGKAAGGGLH